VPKECRSVQNSCRKAPEPVPHGAWHHAERPGNGGLLLATHELPHCFENQTNAGRFPRECFDWKNALEMSALAPRKTNPLDYRPLARTGTDELALDPYVGPDKPLDAAPRTLAASESFLRRRCNLAAISANVPREYV
jgi:hypothetical protein